MLAEGTTTISNAAMEPHVQDVCRCLNAMGASIKGIGTHDLVVEGVPTLHGAHFDIGPDYMEVGSLIGLAAATGSRIRIKGAHPHEHRMTRIMYGRLGVDWQDDGDDIVVPADQELAVVPDFDGHRAEDRRHALARLSAGPHQHRSRAGDAEPWHCAHPPEDVRPPPGIRGPADRDGRRHRALRPAPRLGDGAEPAARRAVGVPGHPRRHGVGDCRAVRRGARAPSTTCIRSTVATSASMRAC